VITSKGQFLYNGRFLEDPNVHTYGTKSLGVEHVAKKGLVCRGVLLDAVALRGGQLPIPKKLVLVTRATLPLTTSLR
jgi:hypothetical protein